MRLLACTETVTLVRHVQNPDGDSYERETIHGCSWHEKTGGSLSASGEQPNASVIVRIPADVAPVQLPAIGDYLIKGNLPPRTQVDPGNLARLNAYLPRLNAFRISKVGNNLRKPLPHVVVMCE